MNPVSARRFFPKYSVICGLHTNATIATDTPSEPQDVQDVIASESSSLLSDVPGDLASEDGDDRHHVHHHHSHHRADISGFNLLRKPEFYSIWVMLGILTGIGLMTINNIGNDVSSVLHNVSPLHWKPLILDRRKHSGTPLTAKHQNPSSCNAS
jgi:hypothetical protein